MSKTLLQEALERAYPNPQNDWLNPDNHDKVHIALGLFEAESAEKNRQTMEDLGRKIAELAYTIGTSLERETKKIIESNDEASKINKEAIRWNKRLTIALIVVTLIVGLLQAYVIWETAQRQKVSNLPLPFVSLT